MFNFAACDQLDFAQLLLINFVRNETPDNYLCKIKKIHLKIDERSGPIHKKDNSSDD